MLPRFDDPIVAIATAPGRGAVGIVRVSGPSLTSLIDAICARALKPREATYLPFRAADGVQLAMALYGSGPPVVKAATWLTHIERDPASDFNGHWIAELARRVTDFTNRPSRTSGASGPSGFRS